MGITWFNSDKRRNHKFMVFDPSRIYGLDEEAYNYLKGYNHTPNRGDLSKSEYFIRNIIWYNAEVDYHFPAGQALAHKLLHAQRLNLEFATVLQGDKGIGKTFYAEMIQDLIGHRVLQDSLSEREVFQ